MINVSGFRFYNDNLDSNLDSIMTTPIHVYPKRKGVGVTRKLCLAV